MKPQLLLLAVLCAVPGVIEAQDLPVRIVRRGDRAMEVSTGEPVSYFLEHSREIELTETQKDQLIVIRRKLRVQNAPFTAQLDSIRDLLGIDLEPRQRLSDKDQEKLERFQKLAAPIADSMRVNNDAARAEAWALLQPDQQKRVDSILKADREGRARERRGPARPPDR